MSDPRLVTPRQANPQDRHFYDAVQQLSLTPQEQFLYRHHLRNLYMGGRVMQPGGEISTALQVPVQGPGGWYNIPTVWQGQILPVPVAANMARLYGWDQWPVYGSEDEANARYMQMHAFMERDSGAWRDANPPGPDRPDDQRDLQRPIGQAPDHR
jgi:hypothetical protein